MYLQVPWYKNVYLINFARFRLLVVCLQVYVLYLYKCLNIRSPLQDSVYMLYLEFIYCVISGIIIVFFQKLFHL